MNGIGGIGGYSDYNFSDYNQIGLTNQNLRPGNLEIPTQGQRSFLGRKSSDHNGPSVWTKFKDYFKRIGKAFIGKEHQPKPNFKQEEPIVAQAISAESPTAIPSLNRGLYDEQLSNWEDFQAGRDGEKTEEEPDALDSTEEKQAPHKPSLSLDTNRSSNLNNLGSRLNSARLTNQNQMPKSDESREFAQIIKELSSGQEEDFLLESLKNQYNPYKAANLTGESFNS